MKRALYGLGAVVFVALLVWLGLALFDSSDGLEEAGPIRSMAVLPFLFEDEAGDQSSADESDQLSYLSKEVAEGLINRLSEVEELQVMAWSTVQRYQGQVDNPLEAGRELQVDAVLTGRVSKRDDMVTVQATLLDTRQGFQIWGDRFQEPFAESADFQDRVAFNVVQRLGYQLAASAGAEEASSAPDPEAYTHYLEARHKQSEERIAERDAWEVEKQIEAYQRALAIDADYLKAQQGLAELLSKAGSAGHLDPEVAMPMAKDAALKLLELKKGGIQTHNVLATVYSRFERDWDKTEEELETALEMNPRSVETLQHYAMDYLIPTGQLEEAEEALRRALKLRPGSAALLLDLGRLHYYRRNFDEALQVFRQADAGGSPGWTAEQYSALCLVVSGRPLRAVRLLERRVRDNQEETFNPARSQAMAVLGLAYGRAGRKERAQRILERLTRRDRPGLLLTSPPQGREPGRRPDRPSDPHAAPSPQPSAPPPPPPPGQPLSRPFSAVIQAGMSPGLIVGEWGSRPYWTALVHLGLGEEETAMQLLSRAVQARAAEAVYLNVDPVMDPLRRREDFQRLIEELNLDD